MAKAKTYTIGEVSAQQDLMTWSEIESTFLKNLEVLFVPSLNFKRDPDVVKVAKPLPAIKPGARVKSKKYGYGRVLHKVQDIDSYMVEYMDAGTTLRVTQPRHSLTLIRSS